MSGASNIGMQLQPPPPPPVFGSSLVPLPMQPPLPSFGGVIGVHLPAGGFAQMPCTAVSGVGKRRLQCVRVCVRVCACVCVREYIYIYAHARSFSFTIENPDIPASDMVRGALHSCALKRSRSYGATSRMWWAHCTMSLLWLPGWRASSNVASPNLQCAQACLPSQVPKENTSSSRWAQLTALTQHRSCAEILAGSVC